MAALASLPTNREYAALAETATYAAARLERFHAGKERVDAWADGFIELACELVARLYSERRALLVLRP